MTAQEKLAALLNAHTGDTAPKFHLEKVAREVCALLGAKEKPRLTRKLKDWPQILEEAEDLCQMAAVAFIAAYEKGRIREDEKTGRHTAESVSSYVWGICNRIFLNMVRRSALRLAPQPGEPVAGGGGGLLEELIGETPLSGDEARLWEILSIVSAGCSPKDIIVTWLHGCGFSVGEIRKLLALGEHSVNRAIKRIGSKIRELIGSAGGAGGAGGGKKKPGCAGTAFELLKSRKYAELLGLMRDAEERDKLLHEAVAELSAAPGMDEAAEIARRIAAMRETGDWSWGLLTSEERREFFIRDAMLLRGSGTPDGGKAQMEALARLNKEIGNLYKQLDIAVEDEDVDWLRAFSEHLAKYSDMVSNWKEVLPYLERILAASRKPGDDLTVAKALTAQGGLHVRMGDLESADIRFEEAKSILSGSPDNRAMSLLKRWMGIAAFSRGNYESAGLFYNESLELARETGDKYTMAACLNNLGNIARIQARYADAEKLYNESLEIFREIGDKRGMAACLTNLGINAFNQDRYEDAERLSNESLKICREIGDKYAMADCLNNLGNIAINQARYADAERLHYESLEIKRKIGDKRGMAMSLGNLGNIAHAQARYADAEKLYNESLDIWREIGDRSGIANCLSNLGVIAYCQSKYADSEKLHKESLEIKREIGDRSGIAYCLLNLGYSANFQGRYAEAERLHNESLEISREIGERSMIASVQNSQALLQIKFGNLTSARTFLAEALGISKETGGFVIGVKSLIAAGLLLEKTGNTEDCAVLLAGAAYQIKNANFHPDPHIKKALDESLHSVEAELTQDKLSELTARGEAMTLPELLDFALETLEKIRETLESD